MLHQNQWIPPLQQDNKAMFQSLIDFKRVLLRQKGLLCEILCWSGGWSFEKVSKEMAFLWRLYAFVRSKKDGLWFKYYCCSFLFCLSVRIKGLIDTNVWCFTTGILKVSIKKKGLSDVCPNAPNSQYAKPASLSLSPPKDVISESNCRKFPLIQDASNYPSWFWGENMMLLLCQHLESSLIGKTEKQSF